MKQSATSTNGQQQSHASSLTLEEQLAAAAAAAVAIENLRQRNHDHAGEQQKPHQHIAEVIQSNTNDNKGQLELGQINSGGEGGSIVFPVTSTSITLEKSTQSPKVSLIRILYIFGVQLCQLHFQRRGTHFFYGGKASAV